jgi:hypothetical protein
MHRRAHVGYHGTHDAPLLRQPLNADVAGFSCARKHAPTATGLTIADEARPERLHSCDHLGLVGTAEAAADAIVRSVLRVGPGMRAEHGLDVLAVRRPACERSQDSIRWR